MRIKQTFWDSAWELNTLSTSTLRMQAPSDFEMGDELIKKGSWVLVTKASDEIWEQIQKGDITGYSMAGTADIGKQEREPASEEKGLFSLLKNFFLSKGEVKNRYDKGRMQEPLSTIC